MGSPTDVVLLLLAGLLGVVALIVGAVHLEIARNKAEQRRGELLLRYLEHLERRTPCICKDCREWRQGRRHLVAGSGR